ncbi:MAG TPA: response regulator [Methyloprofundus sp.]|uniref:sigma 54-interacting transcriptional regulator n=1 Tax=Methyloprofundus sp. TaxID=2020875 RepID=UPI0017C33179|nr:sigma 54-interacting transcriptional regulator [Methyloprofundus sp.]HIG65928.1 response regulator [Methyloprofundus sp.]HIL78977.1 response regulator [Methylococcales bacterium]
MSNSFPNQFNKQSILLVDDDPSLLELLSLRFTAVGLTVITAGSGIEALSLIPQCYPDLIITDLRMDEMDGVQLSRLIQQNYPTLPIIIISAHGTIKEAVDATCEGVFGFITKPIDHGELLDKIAKALTLSSGNSHGKEVEDWRAKILTRSQLMENLLNEVKRLAQGDASLFIHGESGTGKELIAQAIHKASPRHEAPFIAVNCSAIPEDLLESELFGHRKGAFSGAFEHRQGLFQAADTGTLFLDEIGDMSAAFQVKLLRALQERQIRPVGANSSIAVDVRIVSASHHDLEQKSHDGEFRMDLYYRLNVATLTLPKLSERREDISLLANYFITHPESTYGYVAKGFSNQAMELLLSYDWPGNIRQLQNVVEHVSALATTPIVPVNLVERVLQEKSNTLQGLKEAKCQFEKEYLIKLLKSVDGNVTQAARLAKRNRTEFYKLLERHQLKPTRFK